MTFQIAGLFLCHLKLYFLHILGNPNPPNPRPFLVKRVSFLRRHAFCRRFPKGKPTFSFFHNQRFGIPLELPNSGCSNVCWKSHKIEDDMFNNILRLKSQPKTYIYHELLELQPPCPTTIYTYRILQHHFTNVLSYRFRDMRSCLFIAAAGHAWNLMARPQDL